MLWPKVVDLSHYQPHSDFAAAHAAGIRGIICKCTESVTTVDSTYHQRREPALKAGMLWGAYHFIRPGNMAAQARYFVDHAAPDEHTLMALDHEDRNVSLGHAREFVEEVEARIKRKVVLYSGFVLKEQIRNHVDPWWSARRLWLADYRAQPTWPPCWKDVWLLQYTGDGAGRGPHAIAGLGQKLDVNSYGGTDEQLAREWPGDAI